MTATRDAPGLLETDAFKGYTVVQCPMGDCEHEHKFVETIHTTKIAERPEAYRRRLAYLKLCHEAGRHA